MIKPINCLISYTFDRAEVSHRSLDSLIGFFDAEYNKVQYYCFSHICWHSWHYSLPDCLSRTYEAIQVGSLILGSSALLVEVSLGKKLNLKFPPMT